jgi:hypothetical protein
MLKKTIIALVAALALITSFDSGAKAQGSCGEWASGAALTPVRVADTRPPRNAKGPPSLLDGPISFAEPN